jgi:cobalamin biosynthesis protein CbiG
MSAPRSPVVNLTITPVEVEVEGCLATVLEVARLPLPWTEYLASVQVRCDYNGREAISQVFQVHFKDSDELKRKLTIEVTKFRYHLFLMGLDELKKRGLTV